MAATCMEEGSRGTVYNRDPAFSQMPKNAISKRQPWGELHSDHSPLLHRVMYDLVRFSFDWVR